MQMGTVGWPGVGWGATQTSASEGSEHPFPGGEQLRLERQVRAEALDHPTEERRPSLRLLLTQRFPPAWLC